MNKFKLATKKIAAVGTAVAVASSSALAAFPGMFVMDDKFDAQVVVGASAAASDTTAAEALIASLGDRYSGDSNQVEITATMRSGGGESVSAIDDKQTLNFGVTNFNSIKETLDEDSVDLLSDEELDSEKYSQELVLGDNLEFNYRLFKEVDKEEATDGVYIANGETYATYTLDFDSALTGTDIASDDTNTMVGETLTIMGNEFTVIALESDTMTLIGGSNKVALGESEETTVEVDGKSYTIAVQSVSSDKVLLTVNGQSQSIDNYEVEDVAGISVAVTDLVDSSRDSVKGYVEVVVGGQKIEIESSGDVKINDEDFDDVYPDYEVSATFASAQTLTITYAIDDEVLLERGDSLEDPLFGSFTLSYDGLNSVDYSTLEITSSSDLIEFNGNLYDGEEIPSEFVISVDDSSSTANDNFQLGDEDERIFFSGSTNASVDLTSNLDGVIAGLTNVANTSLTFDLNNSALDLDDQIFFTQETEKEDMHFFKVKSSNDDGVDSTISFEDLLGSTFDDREADELESDLDSITFTDAGTVVTVTLASLSENNGETVFTGTDAQLYLENELIMNFQQAESGDLIQFGYSSDADADDETTTLDNIINVSYNQVNGDADTDAIELRVSFSDAAASAFEIEEDSDYDMLVDAYGTRVTFDTEDYKSVKIEVPDEEVYGTLSFNFGGAGVETITRTVAAADVESVKEDLIAEGYTIVSENPLASEDVEFMIDGVTLDVDASAENAIVVGGPAVNAIARELMGIETYDVSQAGVGPNEGIARVFEEENSVLIYGYSAADTTAIVNKVIDGSATFQ